MLACSAQILCVCVCVKVCNIYISSQARGVFAPEQLKQTHR